MNMLLIFAAAYVMYEHGLRLGREAPGPKSLQKQVLRLLVRLYTLTVSAANLALNRNCIKLFLCIGVVCLRECRDSIVQFRAQRWIDLYAGQRKVECRFFFCCGDAPVHMFTYRPSPSTKKLNMDLED